MSLILRCILLAGLTLGTVQAHWLVWLHDCQDYQPLQQQLPMLQVVEPLADCQYPYFTVRARQPEQAWLLYSQLASSPWVAAIEPEIQAHSQRLPLDALWPEQWAMQPPTGVDLPLLWQHNASCSEVLLMQMDHGVDWFHHGQPSPPENFTGDLAGALFANPEQLDWPTIRQSLTPQSHGLNLFCPHQGDCMHQDLDGHGTHVAGIMLARHNQQGIAGVCPDASLVSINFLGSRWRPGGYTSDILASWRYVQQLLALLPPEQPVVWNNSWYLGSMSQQSLSLLHDILIEHQDRLLMVVAAGNHGLDQDALSAIPVSLSRDHANVMTIANAQQDGGLHRSSNHGWRTVDLALPGTAILSTGRNHPDVLPAQGLPQGYVKMTGTSMAAPLASGLAAWLWHQQPELSAAQVRARLLAAVQLDANQSPRLRYSGPLQAGLLLQERQALLIRDIEQSATQIRFLAWDWHPLASVTLNGQPMAYQIEDDWLVLDIEQLVHPAWLAFHDHQQLLWQWWLVPEGFQEVDSGGGSATPSITLVPSPSLTPSPDLSPSTEPSSSPTLPTDHEKGDLGGQASTPRPCLLRDQLLKDQSTELQRMRSWRDQYLMHLAWGRALVTWYYRFSAWLLT